MKVLVVEDDRQLAAMLAKCLESRKYEVQVCYTFAQALAETEHAYDIFLLDLSLPDGNGLDLLAWIRTRFQGAIIILSSRKDDASILEGYQLQADLYLEKPVRLPVLMAGLESVLRRTGQLENSMKFHDWQLDRSNGIVRHMPSHQEARCSRLEMEILWLLARHPDTYVSTDLLQASLDQSTGSRPPVESVRVRVSEMRKKLAPLSIRISSRREFGYRWDYEEE